MKNQNDVIEIILEDHKPLKKLLKVMKDSDSSISERREAFEEFAPLLLSHAKAEDKVVYTFMKDEDDMREEGFEGQVEHGLAEETLKAAQAASDEDLWSARVKVLAELVEHHIQEEEKEQFPDLKKHSSAEQRSEMGRQYLEIKQELANTSEDSEEAKGPRAEKTVRGGMRV